MKPHVRLLVVLMMALLAVAVPLLAIHAVLADAAPPPEAAASGIAPGQGTQVQMISETVVLDIRAEPMIRYETLFTPTVAYVTADFLMRNLGSQAETMDVRFPMAWPTKNEGLPYEPVQNIQIWVNGRQVITHPADYGGQPWVTWPVTFSAGQDVRLTVKYRTQATEWYNAFLNSFSFVQLGGNESLAEFYYILETGAGWRGPIGQGDIIFRFPYEASLEMIESSDYFWPAYTSTTPSFVAEGRDLRWHFENLEPTSKDNVNLSVITPPMWQAILDARRHVQRNPNDAQAQIRLGEAYWAAIPIKNTWPEEMSLAQHFGPLAEAAFKHAVELAPDSVLAHLSYARFLTYHAWGLASEAYYSRADQEVKHVLEMDPENAAARDLAVFLHDVIYSIELVTPTPTVEYLRPTSIPTSVPSAAPTVAATHDELERALASKVHGESSALCEWEVARQTQRQIYVWAYCQSIVNDSAVSAPAVIYIGPDGHVQRVDMPRDGSYYGPDVRALFPPDVQQRIFADAFDIKTMGEHLTARRAQLRVTPAASTATLLPISSPTVLKLPTMESTASPAADSSTDSTNANSLPLLGGGVVVVVILAVVYSRLRK